MSPDILSHIAPFAVWISFIAFFEISKLAGYQLPDSWLAPAYAVKSLLCIVLLLVLKPWKFYVAKKDHNARDISMGIISGIILAFIWIFPETPFVRAHAPYVFDFYNKWLIMPISSYPDYFSAEHFPSVPPSCSSLAYSPSHCGWFLTISKLIGSAFVISIAEEYFFRGFLYRWLRKNDFTSISLSKFDVQFFWIVVFIFGLEHDRWFAGMIAGIIFGLLALRTGRIMPAAIAHAVTNLILGIYIIISNQYGFW